MTRTAVVSGGGTGIGAAIAGALAASGHRVVLLGRREHVLARTAARLDSEFGVGTAGWVPVDLSDPAQVRRAVSTAAVHDGQAPRIDVVVNNAGGTSRISGDTLESTAAHWNDEWQRNVLTAVLLTTEALPLLQARPGARVITVSSVAALRGGGPYGAAKAALHAWTYTLAAQFGAGGTANVVAPGFVDGTEFFGDRMTPRRRTALVDATLVGRPASPAGVASAVGWLASAEAADVTGQVIQINGGAVLGRG